VASDTASCYFRSVKDRPAHEFNAWQEKCRKLITDTWGVRILRRTAVVWVPLPGMGTAMAVKMRKNADAGPKPSALRDARKKRGAEFSTSGKGEERERGPQGVW
jgi:hypothetical protein